MKIKVIIVDDEELARSRLQRQLRNYPDIDIVGEAGNGEEALELIGRIGPDAVFLDIRMPLLSGFEMLKKLDSVPHIVFTTAYDTFALQAFEENAVDYLLKPISQERLDQAVEKLRNITKGEKSVTLDLQKLVESIHRREDRMRRFSVRVGDRILLIPDSDVIFFQSEDKYTFLHTVEDRYIVPFSIKTLEERLDTERFIRVHRASIVNIDRIQTIHRWFKGKLKLRMKSGQEIIVSQNYAKAFRDMIHL